jgi:hypothetical protein
MTTKGNGKTIKWIREHVDYPHDWCLMWPFGAKLHGYGQFGYLGKHYYAHRFMCELKHGSPAPGHEAAHSCGRGHEGCVNPNHLSWKTKSGNQLDCREHGTQAKHTGGNKGRITRAQAAEIRGLKGIALQREVAEQFAVSESTVSDIWLNRTHKAPSKIVHWTPADDAKLMEAIALKMSFRKAAEYVGRRPSAVTGRAYRLGLKSGYELNRPRNPPYRT